MDEIHINLGDIPASVTEPAALGIGAFSSPLILDGEFIGSATLIKFGQTHGFLTAAHVVQNPKDSRRSIDISSTQRLGTAIDQSARSLSVPVGLLDIEKLGSPPFEKWGPDLAFIRLPDTDLLQKLKATKLFLDISLNFGRRYVEALDHSSSYLIISGYPQEEITSEKPELGFTRVTGAHGFGFIGGQDDYCVRGEFDYLEVRADSRLELPKNFKGVSGGGVWRAPVTFVKGDDGSISYEAQNPLLAGVAYFQLDDVGNFTPLRAHGPVSLYQTFFPRILKRWEPGLLDQISMKL